MVMALGVGVMATMGKDIEMIGIQVHHGTTAAIMGVVDLSIIMGEEDMATATMDEEDTITVIMGEEDTMAIMGGATTTATMGEADMTIIMTITLTE
mmetsp:Transcript_91210/g.144072  ORF Transcript_91210/g.144072 Transcript_91210/m.144072 type:complete len:96 (-) Transcript_91210:100-387(-)